MDGHSLQESTETARDTLMALERLKAAVVDGRAESIRHRQSQLQSLHQALANNADRICNALLSSTSPQPPPLGMKHDSVTERKKSEVETEFFLAMDAVRHFYDSLPTMDTYLFHENRIATGSEHPYRRVGVGMVVIRPGEHTRFCSVVSPLAAALTAGNCVVVELTVST